MRLLARISIVVLLVGAGTGLLALQRGGYQQDDEFGSARQARLEGYENGEAKSEYAWSRLRYTAANSFGGGYGYGRWSSWSRAYPKADRRNCWRQCSGAATRHIHSWLRRFHSPPGGLALRNRIHHLVDTPRVGGRAGPSLHPRRS